MKYQFWQEHSSPVELWSEKGTWQYRAFCENNINRTQVIERGFVINAVDWKYSSARNAQEGNSILEIDDMGFLA